VGSLQRPYADILYLKSFHLAGAATYIDALTAIIEENIVGIAAGFGRGAERAACRVQQRQHRRVSEHDGEQDGCSAGRHRKITTQALHLPMCDRAMCIQIDERDFLRVRNVDEGAAVPRVDTSAPASVISP
jgi:hypothetical protein